MICDGLDLCTRELRPVFTEELDMGAIEPRTWWINSRPARQQRHDNRSGGRGLPYESHWNERPVKQLERDDGDAVE